MTSRLLPPSSILITGCSSGIGYYCAHQLQRAGYQVIASARNLDDVHRLQAEGLQAVQIDLASTDSIRSGLEQVLQLSGGKLDALFNNGAFGLPGAVEDLSREAMRYQFETNVFGTQELTNCVIPIMRQQGRGRIFYNSSILGFAAMPYRGAYNASKYALEGFADTLRLEVADDAIQISLIEPGPILSDFRKNAFAQFQHWIDPMHSAHKAQYQAMTNRLETVGPSAPFTLGPEAVYQALLHGLQAKRARIRYRVTVPTKIFALLKRLLPSRWLDRLLRKAGGDGKR
ncbi:MAG: SDR family oxidoreductase [Thiotrichales bacterium]|nr:SDR family oxidoreductase [Thiotrichales bacterium]